MRGQSLHVRAFLVVAVIASAMAAVLALGSSPGALAANPNSPCDSPSSQIISCHFSGSFADNDFCGTGQTIDVVFEGRFTVPVAPNQPVDTWNNSESNAVLTNPSTGATVLTHSAYRFTGTLISGDPNGVHTVQWVFKGAAEIIRDPHGGVLSRDAGYLVVDATFNGDDLISTEIVADRGGHPLFGNDCSVLAPALGLT
jgi:hypothetical protein